MKKLSDFCNVYSGYAFKEFNDSKNGNPVLKIGNININGTINLENCQYSNEVVNEKYISQRNDLYIALSGATTGKVGIMNSDEKFYINQRVGIIRCKNNNIPVEYLKHYLISKTNKILSDASGCAQPNISPKMLENYPIKDLEIHQMSEIADRLKKITDLIQKNKTLIKKYEELVKSQFIEMFGDVNTNPKRWGMTKLQNICSSIVRGPFGSALKKEFFVEKNDTTYKVYEQKNAIQKSEKLGTYYITKEKYEELKRFECKPNDFIMSCSGTMGELYQLPASSEKGIINQALCKFTLNGKMNSTVFLEFMKDAIRNIETKGSGIQNIASVIYIKNLDVYVPPIELQNQFADFVKHIDKLKFTLKQTLEKLENCYNSLMQEYFE